MIQQLHLVPALHERLAEGPRVDDVTTQVQVAENSENGLHDALGFVGENLNRLEAHRVVLVDRSDADHAGVVQGQHGRRY